MVELRVEYAVTITMWNYYANPGVDTDCFDKSVGNNPHYCVVINDEEHNRAIVFRILAKNLDDNVISAAVSDGYRALDSMRGKSR